MATWSSSAGAADHFSVDDYIVTPEESQEEVIIIHNGATVPAQIDHNKMENPDVEFLVALPPPKRRQLRSKAWDYFTTVEEPNGKEYAICKHCNKRYARSMKKETSNLLKHIDKCPGGRHGGEDKPVDTRGITTSVIKGKFAPDQEWNRLILARAIIQNGYPWRIDEQDFLGSNLQPENNLNADILHIYRGEKEKLHRILDNPLSRFNLTVSLLRHNYKTIYCYLTLHFIDDGWELKNKILAFRKLDFWNTYWDLVMAFRSMLLDWKISKSICSVTAQNTNEDDEIVEGMKNWLAHEYGLPFNGKLLRVGCFAHILDLLVNDGFQEVNDFFNKMMKCFSYVHSTRDNYDRFQRAVQYLRSEGKKVTFEDIPRSWTFSIQLLEKALGLREAFDLLQLFDFEFSLNPLAEEWDEATLICECLKVIDEAVQWFSKGRRLTTNLYFPQACKLHKRLCEWMRSRNSKVSLMASKMKTKFDVYWNNSSLVLAIAVILDPRFKFDIVERWYSEIYGEDIERHCAKIYDTLAEVYREYASGSSNDLASSSSASLSAAASSSKSCDTGNMLDPLGMLCTLSHDGDDDGGKSRKSELVRYMEESKYLAVEGFDILGWWHVHTLNFPILAKLARDFLAIPMSAALSNPAFNADIVKIDPASTNIAPEIIEALICAKDWLRMTENKD